ncbi:tetratricopeptide repeat protein [Emticicia sp. C21]|uniref:tetratricopeptide repeat protein n=1 Tax=Emticicia sp. C21 TaxID=2302915 RepID=UPI000E349619|nr:tetratricopeptide repeat protein [Emticicia sp. C21]RFS18427.1 tetratricopeptide repeat protein [Emticicia sp. C21]
MKNILFIICILFSFGSLAQGQKIDATIAGNNNIIKVLQNSKSKDQNTGINVKGSNNTVIVIQYDLDKTADYQNFITYLTINLKEVRVANDVAALTQKNTELIKALVAKSKESGFFDPNKFLAEFDNLKTENNKLKNKVAILIKQSKEPEFIAVLRKANTALERFDHKAYQDILQQYKVKKKKEIAKTSYLQAQDSRITFLFDSALVQIDEALVIEPNNPGYLTEKGDIYYQKGEFRYALTYYQNALKVRAEKAENEDLDVAKSYNNIGQVYSNLGELDSALLFYEKTLAIYKNKQTDDQSIANAFNNIGSVYNEKGEFNKALDYHKRALIIEKKNSAKEKENIAISYGNMAMAFNNKGEHDKAIEYLTKALTIQWKVFGKGHPDLAISYNNIGFVYKIKGNNAKALENYKKAMSIEEKLLGQGHLNTGISYHNIAGVYSDIKEYSKAIEYYEKALKIREFTLGENHLDVAASSNNIGLTYSRNGEYNKALKEYQKVLLILSKQQEKHESEEATTYNNIGLLYDNKGDYEKAIEYYQKALEIREKIFGKEHQPLLDLYKSIGMVYIAKGETERGKEWLSKSSFVKETDSNKAILLNSEGMNAFIVKQYSAAIRFYEFALEYLEESHAPRTGQLWVIFYNNLAKAYCQQGNKDKALSLFEKAIDLGTQNALNIEQVVNNYEECKKK